MFCAGIHDQSRGARRAISSTTVGIIADAYREEEEEKKKRDSGFYSGNASGLTPGAVQAEDRTERSSTGRLTRVAKISTTGNSSTPQQEEPSGRNHPRRDFPGWVLSREAALKLGGVSVRQVAVLAIAVIAVSGSVEAVARNSENHFRELARARRTPAMTPCRTARS
jgi:hypothetical protein